MWSGLCVISSCYSTSFSILCNYLEVLCLAVVCVCVCFTFQCKEGVNTYWETDFSLTKQMEDEYVQSCLEVKSHFVLRTESQDKTRTFSVWRVRPKQPLCPKHTVTVFSHMYLSVSRKLLEYPYNRRSHLLELIEPEFSLLGKLFQNIKEKRIKYENTGGGGADKNWKITVKDQFSAGKFSATTAVMLTDLQRLRAWC